MSGPAGPDEPNDSGHRSAFGLLNLALDNRRLLVLLPLGVAALAFLFATLVGPEYTASSAIVPESTSQSLGDLGGLAAQFGFGAALGNQDESVFFYAGLATSRALLEEVARRTYRFPAREGSSRMIEGTVPELFDVQGDTPEERLRETVALLAEHVEVEAERNAGMVNIRTRAPWAGLAVELNRAIIEAVSRFNLEQRQSSAAAERKFIEGQVEDARADLQEAEDELQRFLENNRRYENLPELRFQAQRLQRQVDLVQSLYTSLAQSLQNARIEEVRSTPTITIISPPENSARKTTSRLRTTFLGFMLGLVIALAWVYLHEYGIRQRQRAPDEYAAFRDRKRRLFRFRRG